jgi:hypothetical protein
MPRSVSHPLTFVLLASLLALGATGPAAAATPTCGAPQLDPDTLARVEALAAGAKDLPVFATKTIPVAFHVLMASKTVGAVSDSQIQAQIELMNERFAPTGFSFTLARTDRTRNAKWYNACGLGTANENAMKRRLARDPRHTLNIYSCKIKGAGLPDGIIGYAYFPFMYPESHYLNGVVVDPDVLPAGSLAGYDLGLTAVHEAGHYLGLLHTFQGGCYDMDWVDDTPAQAEPSFSCDTSIDTCVGGGNDDVQNYMNYADDYCPDHFTPGQIDFMHQQVSMWRPSL